MNNTTGIIILAAGSSSRLGQPKQLLNYRGKAMLQHIIEESVAAAKDHVVVVLGAYFNEIVKSGLSSNVNYIINDSWQDGLSSSIAAGITAILNKNEQLESVILTVADQPFTTSTLLMELIRQHHESKKGIIASKYNQAMGTPALFHRNYFDQLLGLSGQDGAKKLFIQYKSDIKTVTFEKGSIDIDTEQDYKNLLKNQEGR